MKYQKIAKLEFSDDAKAPFEEFVEISEDLESDSDFKIVHTVEDTTDVYELVKAVEEGDQ